MANISQASARTTLHDSSSNDPGKKKKSEGGSGGDDDNDNDRYRRGLEALAPLGPLLAGFNHRNRNQHRGARWWGAFGMLRRHAAKLVGELDGAAARAARLSAAAAAGRRRQKTKKRRRLGRGEEEDGAGEGEAPTGDGGHAPVVVVAEFARADARAVWFRDVLVPRCYLYVITGYLTPLPYHIRVPDPLNFPFPVSTYRRFCELTSHLLSLLQTAPSPSSRRTTSSRRWASCSWASWRRSAPHACSWSGTPPPPSPSRRYHQRGLEDPTRNRQWWPPPII